MTLEFGDLRIETRLVALDENSMTVEIANGNQENIDETTEILNEFIPLLIGAASLGLSAYDAYNAYKDFKAGNITQGDLAKQVGTSAALSLVGGGAAKLIGKGAQLATRGVKSAASAIGRKLVPAARPIDNVLAKQAAKKSDDVPARKSKRRPDAGYASADSSPYTGDLAGAVSRASMFNSVEYRLPMIEGALLVKEDKSQATSRYWNYKVW